MSSRYSTSGTESDSGVGGKQTRRVFLRGESLHVPAPPKKPATAAPSEISKDPGALLPETSGAKGVKYQNELSVIEESLMSHEETQSQSQSQSQSQPASLLSSGGAIDRLVRNIACQTDIDLLESLFFAWAKPPISKRSHSQRIDKTKTPPGGLVTSRTPRRAQTERRQLRHRGGKGGDNDSYR